MQKLNRVSKQRLRFTLKSSPKSKNDNAKFPKNPRIAAFNA